MSSKTGPIVGIVGVLALVGASISLFKGQGSLDERIDAYFRRVDEASSPLTGAGDVQAQIVEVESFIGHEDFDDLPQEKQDKVNRHKKELLAYRDYEAELNKITPPGEAKVETDLRRIRKNLDALSAPKEYAEDWSKTPAGKKHQTWRTDAAALELAVTDMTRVYEELHKDARQVIDNQNAADLPGRAQKVLDRAAAMPNPNEGGRTPIQGGIEVTYATVFAFPPAKEAYAEWLKDKTELTRLVKK
ncbi:MAG: hypothetical protein AB7K24_01110 [Gemmataceae bacterium]